jgi:outer membrane protein assembly factor BamD
MQRQIIRSSRFTIAIQKVSLILLLIVFVASCKTQHQRIMDSDDYDLKMEYAQKYMDDGRYSLAKPLLNDLIRFYRGTHKVIDLYYMYAEAQFKSENFVMASHYYKTLAETFPDNEMAESALFKHAFSLYQLSPRSSLDQTFTRRAIQGFQLFVNTYPRSDLVERSHWYMDEMRMKLEAKAIDNAILYYRIGDYRAAVWSLERVLQRFPDTGQREELEFLMLEASYKLARRSVPDMQHERFQETIDYYNRFANRFPESDKMRDARNMYQSAQAFFEN